MHDVYENNNRTYSNTLPTGGVVAKYTADHGFFNIEKMKKYLDKENKIIFEDSLSWYATESEFPVTKINGKTTKEIVDIVNCLKTNSSKSIKEKEICF